MTYRSIVVGTDGSPTAHRAVAQAAVLAAADSARLVIVTAYEAGETAPPDVDPDRVPEELRFVLSERVQAEEMGAHGRAAAKEAGVEQVVVQAVAGDPAHVLLDVATDMGADLIVVGSRGLSSHAHFILGSVASTVAHHAPCDVLVAHTTT
jgi:nucleotide-binding universal stress UspA family protein